MGAFSLVRFRSAQGTAREISSLFLAMAVGLALGMGYIGVAAIFTLILGIFTLILELLHFGEKKKQEKEMIDAIRCRNGNLEILCNYGTNQTEGQVL